MILTVQKENKIYKSNSVSESFKIFVVNKSKEIKIKNLKESDKLLGGFSVIDIEKSLVENKKQESIYFVSLQDLVNELNVLFPEVDWDFENERALELLKKYNVCFIDVKYSGLTIETKLGTKQFFYGESMVQDHIALDIPEVCYDELLELQTKLK